ncbi:MAG: hypothetical protein JSR69_09740 [Proteobacteria bacterium]|nr:hypothetical protein [Pseudomonadota bacterium]
MRSVPGGTVSWALLGGVLGGLVGAGMWLEAVIALAAVGFVLLLMAGPWMMALAWLIGVPVVGSFANNVLQVLPFVRLERLGGGLLFAMMVWQVAFRRQARVPFSAMEKRLVAFLSVAGLSVLMVLRGKATGEWLHDDFSFYFDGYLLPMSAYLLARRLEWSESRLRLLMNLLALAAFYLATTAFLETLLAIDWFIPKNTAVIHTIERATGTFGNAAEYGVVISSLFVLCILLLTRALNPGQRLLFGGLLIWILAAAVLSKTRAAWVGLLLSVGLLYVLDRQSRPLLTLMGFTGALGVVVAVPFLLSMHGFEARLTDTGPIYNRIAGWATAVNMMLQNPLLGLHMSRYAFGINRGEYATSFGDVSGAWIRELAVPHNEFFNVGAMTGVLGFVLYLRVFSGVFGELRGIWRAPTCSDTARVFAVHVTAVWLGWLVNANFSDFANFHYINILVFFLAGTAAAVAAQLRPPAPGEPQVGRCM